jgi:4-oxalocrotonate tautomerase
MPFINIKAVENVLSDAQKKEIAERITDTFADVVGEPVRNVTWVVIEEVRSGDYVIAGRPITTGDVMEMLGGAPAAT